MNEGIIGVEREDLEKHGAKVTADMISKMRQLVVIKEIFVIFHYPKIHTTTEEAWTTNKAAMLDAGIINLSGVTRGARTMQNFVRLGSFGSPGWLFPHFYNIFFRK